jgi:hypothetical protein
MRKVHIFDDVSLDGLFTDEKNDMSWAHKRDEEWTAFAGGNARGLIRCKAGLRTRFVFHPQR